MLPAFFGPEKIYLVKLVTSEVCRVFGSSELAEDSRTGQLPKNVAVAVNAASKGLDGSGDVRRIVGAFLWKNNYVELNT